VLDTDPSVSQPPVIPTTWVDAEQTLVQTNIILPVIPVSGIFFPANFEMYWFSSD